MQKDFFSVWCHMNELYTKWADLHDINCSTLLVLYGLDIYGDMTQKMIRERYGLPKQTVNNVIKALQKAGHITLLSAHTDDKREKLVTMTQQGQIYARSLLTPLYTLEQQTIQLVGEERIQQMLEIAGLFNTVFEMKMEESPNEQI